ncbi:hypothetical protein Hanom_Chr15g01392981 [Helianthus anomalus]
MAATLTVGRRKVSRSAEGFLHDYGEGSSSKVVGDKVGDIFFFKSKKRSRRYRKKAVRAHSRDPFNCHGEFMDSCEKNRPTKRNRAQFSNSDVDRFSNRAQEAVNNDLFSLNRLLVQTSREQEKDGGVRRWKRLGLLLALRRCRLPIFVSI